MSRRTRRAFGLPAHSAALWVWAFLFFNSTYIIAESTNGESRFALLSAMTEDHTFSIDRQVWRTIDWSRTPDGHYYSNKAPGPALLAAPVFYLIDRAMLGVARITPMGDDLRRLIEFKLICLLCQVVPMAVLMLILLRHMQENDVPVWQQHFATAAILFGNTSSLFMNTFWGHGVAAVWVLALWLSVVRRRVAWVGFCYGWLVLSDYGAAMLAAPVLWLVFAKDPGWNDLPRSARLRQLVAGGVVPGIVWCVYHQACFGSIFALPNKYQNPDFVETAERTLWGIFSSHPDPNVLWQLLFGSYRGIAVTQPWVLLLLSAGIVTGAISRKNRAFVFAVSGLALLMIMNSAFNGWYGGDAPGPRYLSAIFPIAALSVTEVSRRFRGRSLPLALWALLIPSLVLFVAVYSTASFSSERRLPWPFYWQEIIETGTPVIQAKAALGLVVLLGLLVIGARENLASAEADRADPRATR